MGRDLARAVTRNGLKRDPGTDHQHLCGVKTRPGVTVIPNQNQWSEN